jgi:Flp pilus assembly protein TadD
LKNRVIVLALAGTVVLGGCRQDTPDDQRTETMTPQSIEQARANWPAGLSEVVDSANSAFRARDYTRASQLYREATRIAPTVTAGWFGVHMAEQALGNTVAADSAMTRAMELSPGASLMHGMPADTVHGMPDDTIHRPRQ